MGGLITVLSVALAAHAVSVDQYPLRDGCDVEEPVLAKLSIGDPVEVRFALVGSGGRCYKVVVQSGGETLQGYVSEDGITGTDEFDQARRSASQVSVTASPAVAAATAHRAAPRANSGEPATSSAKSRGFAAPQLSARTFSGSQISLAGLRGKTVLVHFWATWCGPCRKQMPLLARLRQETSGQGVVMLGINRDSDQKKAETYVAQNSYRWPMVFDEGGRLGKSFDVSGIPAVFVIDPNGRIVAQATGEGSGSERRIRAGLRNAGVALP